MPWWYRGVSVWVWVRVGMGWVRGGVLVWVHMGPGSLVPLSLVPGFRVPESDLGSQYQISVPGPDSGLRYQISVPGPDSRILVSDTRLTGPGTGLFD